jgi:hypothetical protein
LRNLKLKALRVARERKSRSRQTLSAMTKALRRIGPSPMGESLLVMEGRS